MQTFRVTFDGLNHLQMARIVQAAHDVAGAAGAVTSRKIKPDARYTVTISSGGVNKINTIRAIREITGWDLATAKNAAERAGGSTAVEIVKNLPHAEAEAVRAKLTEAGATAALSKMTRSDASAAP